MDVISLDILTRRGVSLIETRLFDVDDFVSPLINAGEGKVSINVRESAKFPANTVPTSIVTYVVESSLSAIALAAGSIFIGTVVSVKGRAKNAVHMGFNINRIAGTVKTTDGGSSFLYQESTDPDLVEYVVSETPAQILAQITADERDGFEQTINKDASNGYVGLTLFKINFKNVLNTFTSFFTNSNTAQRTYTFQDRNGTICDNTDLALKANLAGAAFTGSISATNLSGTNTGDQNLSGYAPLASPTFTGTPQAPTAPLATNTTQVATTAFVLANATAGITGSGTTNYIPKFTPNGTTLGNSLLFDDGTNILLGATTPIGGGKFQIYRDSGSVLQTLNNSGFSGFAVYHAANTATLAMYGLAGNLSTEIIGGVGDTYFNQNGKFLIGNNTAIGSGKLQVYADNSQIQTMDSAGINSGVIISQFATQTVIYVYNPGIGVDTLITSGNNLTYFNHAGNTVFGASSDMGYKVGVTGTMKVTGQINYTGLQIGNATLSTGDLYKDTAANILASGDYIVAMKA